ncbi:alpha/beta hydrolase [Winogradskyella sp.]|jgi:pimeloyl-ACP methyl ester carboxylesterase|uniref:serine aminopeptidase domain-containing protein n=1 Tax=Winogradskyella sp. TaxID=1883156 RepID=UPI0025D09A22|nr:alpha/beta hydrolase [Winogradskyella sp.]MCT4630113.1 PDZ domain-containing protein [Winogradskyella sp.]
MKRLINISLLAFLLVAQQGLEAQTLKRKGLLGIMMQTLTDSIASQHNIKVDRGVHLTTVMPKSTFSNLGIKQGDVLTKLNGTSVSSIQDVLEVTSQLYEGDKINAEYYSNNIKSNGSTTLKGRPIETFENGNVTYGEVVYKDNVLRSILVTPKHTRKAPVVFFLQGYTCGSVETVSNDNPMKKLMSDWVNAGFAVYRIEKPGVGDSQSKKHCSEISFYEELIAFKEGYKDLLQQKSIDANNIFMFGHSMGGVIAPLLNEVKAPKGMLVYGTVGKNWYDYMIDLYTVQPKHFGVSDAQIKEDNKVNLKFNNDFLIKKLSGEEMLKNDAYVAFFNAEDFRRNQYIGRHFKFWQSLAAINIPKAWSKVKTNVFAMHGEFDIQAINPNGAKKIAEIVNDNGGEGDFILIKNADHGFVNFNSMQHNSETLGNGSYMTHARDNYAKLLGAESVKWMQSKIKSK